MEDSLTDSKPTMASGNGMSPRKIKFYWYNTWVVSLLTRQQRRKALVSTVICTFLFIGVIANYSFRNETNISGLPPRHNIVFLKTHKCASSTIQNVLMRYGDTNNLTFALPSKLNYFGHPQPFNRIFVPNVGNNTFNILTHHMRFHYEELSLLMPEDTVFITIVREPSELLQSLYSYFLLEDVYELSLEAFLKNQTAMVRNLGVKRYSTRVGINQMAFDLGLDSGDFYRPEIVRRFCGVLDHHFDLVMVSEKMDESLILLMDLLHWNLEDVIVFRHNARKIQSKSKLSPLALQNLRRISLADEIIYNYFVERFEQRVRDYGINKMSEMVNRLRTLSDRIYQMCVSTDEKMFRNESIKTLSFEQQYILQYKPKLVNDTLCDKLLKTELVYTEFLRVKQNKLYPTPKPIPLSTQKPRKVSKFKKIDLQIHRKPRVIL